MLWYIYIYILCYDMWSYVKIYDIYKLYNFISYDIYLLSMFAPMIVLILTTCSQSWLLHPLCGSQRWAAAGGVLAWRKCESHSCVSVGLKLLAILLSIPKYHQLSSIISSIISPNIINYHQLYHQLIISSIIIKYHQCLARFE